MSDVLPAGVSVQSVFSPGDLEDFFENGAVCLHVVGSDGKILRANKAELTLLGYGADEYIGCHIAEFHADAAVIDDILARLSRGERIKRYPARLRAKDGSIRHVEITSSGLFRDGEFIRTRCFTVDVTESKLASERLKEGEEQFRKMIDALPAAIYTTDAEGRITFYNKASVDLAGREPVIGIDRWCVSARLYSLDGNPLPHEECPMAIAIREGKSVRGVEIIAERPDGSRARVLPHPTPLFGQDGQMSGAINMLVDVTERHAAEAENAWLAAVIRSSQDAIITTTLDGRITYWAPGAVQAYGYAPEEMIGQSILSIIPSDRHDEEREILARISRGENIEYYETQRLTKDGRCLDVSLNVTGVRDKQGKIVGVAKVGRDITERKQIERMQRLLMGELNHRVKNTLAIVQAVAQQTVKLTENPSDFADNFGGRLRAIASAHSLLTDTSWQGTDLSALLQDQLLLGGGVDNRIQYSGPALVLDPQTALHLALIAHELGTNARKYGSLSVPGGRLSIDWSVRTGEGRALSLRWIEEHGPPVMVPTRRGFGTILIEQSLKAHGGKVSVNFGATGLTCEIALPLRDGHLSSGAYRSDFIASDSQRKDERRSMDIRGSRILIVDDEALIAMDASSILEDHGCKVVGPAATIVEARRLVENYRLDAALLDANLAGESVAEVAAILTRLNVPFAFLTGYGREGLPESFRQAPLLQKPYSQTQMIETVAQLVSRQEQVVPMRRKVLE